MPEGLKAPRNLDEALETARKLPTYARLIWDLARDPRVPNQQKLVLGAVAAYLALPIDIIPDFIPVLGELDDVAVLVIGLDWFIRNAPPDVVAEHMAKIAKHEDTLSKDLSSVGALLEGRAKELRATLDKILSRQEGEE